MLVVFFSCRWSADTMAQYQRQQRTLDLLRRRHSQNSQLHSTDNATSTTASSPRASSSKEASADNNNKKSSSKRSLEEMNTGDKETPVQSPAGKRGRAAKTATPSSATSAVVASVEASKKGSSSGISKVRGSNGKKLSKSARRFLKVPFLLTVKCAFENYTRFSAQCILDRPLYVSLYVLIFAHRFIYICRFRKLGAAS